jgi:hypothetical protein
LTVDVSVIVVNWNSRERLDACIASLVEAPDAISREIIVVDNDSSDGSVDHLRAQWPDVNVVALPRNQGFGVANNVGFAVSRGTYVLVLNPDTRVLPGMLTAMASTLREDPTIGCVGAKHYNPDMSLQWSMDDFPSLLNESIHYCDVHRLSFVRKWLRKRYPRWSDHDVPTDVSWVNGACMMVPRKVYSATGGFDEYFFLFAEELDWCLRIWRAGWRVRFIPTARVIHELGGTFDPLDTNRLVMIYQSSLRYYRRHNSIGERFGIHFVIRANAAVRIVLIAAMAAGERITGHQVSARFRRALIQHDAPLPLPTAMRMWWAILTLRTDASLRPVTPSRARA